MGGMPGGMGGPPMGGMPGGMGGPPMGGMPGGMGGPMMGGPVVASGGGMSKMKLIGGIIGGVVIAILVIIGAVYASGKSSLRVVNAAGASPVSIFIDGKLVDDSSGKDVPYSPTEDSSKVRSVTIPAGKHKLEAKDATGKVLDTQSMEFDGFFGTYLYAPAHSPKVCFVYQTDAYGSARVANPFTPLDNTKHIWKITKSVDRYFQDTPDSVKLDKKKSGTTKTALRQITCGDPNFQN